MNINYLINHSWINIQVKVKFDTEFKVSKIKKAIHKKYIFSAL